MPLVIIACMHATIPGAGTSAPSTTQPAQPSRERAPALSPADHALVRDLGGFAKFILHSGGKEFYEAVGELDLSISQIRILHLLPRDVETASLKGFADAIGLPLPAVSRSIDGLVHRE